MGVEPTIVLFLERKCFYGEYRINTPDYKDNKIFLKYVLKQKLFYNYNKVIEFYIIYIVDMKHLKRFEKSVNIKFKIGDYVTIISDVFNCRVGQTGFVEKCDDDGGCHILLLNSTVTYYWNGELRLA